MPETCRPPAVFRNTALAGGCLLGLITGGCGRTMPSDNAWFKDVATEIGIDFKHENGAAGAHRFIEVLPGGMAVADLDNDRDQDLVFVQSGPSTPDRAGWKQPTLRVYRNDGKLRFSDITESCGLSRDLGYAHGVAVADVDGDSRPDFFVTTLQGNRLLRNVDGVRFDDVTRAWGLDGGRGYGTSAVFGDVDGDQRPDLLVCRYADWKPDSEIACSTAGLPDYCPPDRYAPSTNLLYRNTGKRFVDFTKESGIGSVPGRALVGSIRDLDGDGDNDILVGTDLTGNQVWFGDGKGKFAESGSATGLAVRADGQRMATMGIASVYEDGFDTESLFLTDFSGSPNPLFRPLGPGLYEDVSASAGLAAPTAPVVSFGTSFLDFDNDGVVDLAIANGHVTEHADKIEAGGMFRQPQMLFQGMPGGRFVPVENRRAPDLAKPALGRGLVSVDLDNDGRRDLVVVRQQDTPLVLHNRHPKPGHWIGFELVGRAPGTDALHAVVEIVAGGKTRRARVSAGESYLSSGDRRLHFGLGEIHAVDSVVVRWPDGKVQRLSDVKVDTYHRVEERGG